MRRWLGALTQCVDTLFAAQENVRVSRRYKDTQVHRFRYRCGDNLSARQIADVRERANRTWTGWQNLQSPQKKTKQTNNKEKRLCNPNICLGISSICCDHQGYKKLKKKNRKRQERSPISILILISVRRLFDGSGQTNSFRALATRHHAGIRPQCALNCVNKLTPNILGIINFQSRSADWRREIAEEWRAASGLIGNYHSRASELCPMPSHRRRLRSSQLSLSCR